MEITILTLFPQMFEGPLSHSIIKRTIEKKLVKINYINIRDFGIGRHKIVDDKPYGGGLGMILRVDVVGKAIAKAKIKKGEKKGQKVILLTPEGATFNQKTAKKLSKLKHLILVCGHYEGIDRRIDKFIDEKISLGDFVLTGGEIPAMAVVDATVRLIKGALPYGVTQEESFSSLMGSGTTHLEYPQYTKPRKYKNLSVPEILFSGNHKAIKNWRGKQSLQQTKGYRPDLLKKIKED